MGRTKKKPGYDQNRIMEQFQNCIVEAYTSGMIDGSGISLRQVSEEFGITLMKTRKILITAGVYHMGALVAEIEVFDNNAINVLRVAVYWVPALLALVFRKRLFSDSTRAENLFANMSLISAFILMIGLVQAANLFARMAAYFEIATAITLPWMIKKLFTKRSAQYVTACAAVLYFIYFLYEFGVSKGFGSGYSSITLWQFITSLFGG